MKKYKKPIIDTYKDMRHLVLMQICYKCQFNQPDTPKEYDCVNFDKLTGDDCPIWLELCECYI
jgi:hypothetical protein